MKRYDCAVNIRSTGIGELPIRHSLTSVFPGVKNPVLVARGDAVVVQMTLLDNAVMEKPKNWR